MKEVQSAYQQNRLAPPRRIPYLPHTQTPAERCRSGRTGRSRKPLSLYGDPGFESLSLRHTVLSRQLISTGARIVPYFRGLAGGGASRDRSCAPISGHFCQKSQCGMSTVDLAMSEMLRIERRCSPVRPRMPESRGAGSSLWSERVAGDHRGSRGRASATGRRRTTSDLSISR